MQLQKGKSNLACSAIWNADSDPDVQILYCPGKNISGERKELLLALYEH
jgi:hypothetical protein